MALSRDDILKAEDIATEEVNCPEWGGTVLVRGMTGRQRDEFESSMIARTPDGKPLDGPIPDVRAKLAARCIVGDDGELLFTLADIEALTGKAAAPLDRIFDVASRLSGVGTKDVEELSRDFSGPAGSGSSTNSPNGSAKQSKGSSAKSAAPS